MKKWHFIHCYIILNSFILVDKIPADEHKTSVERLDLILMYFLICVEKQKHRQAANSFF